MAGSDRDDIAKLEALYSANPESRIFTHLADAYRRDGQLERARELLERGLKLHPDYPSASVVLGRVLLDLDEKGAAEAAFHQVRSIDPQNRIALRALAQIAMDDGRRDEAIDLYSELLLLDPDDDDAAAALGSVSTQPEGEVEPDLVPEAKAGPLDLVGLGEIAAPDDQAPAPHEGVGPAWPEPIRIRPAQLDRPGPGEQEGRGEKAPVGDLDLDSIRWEASTEEPRVVDLDQGIGSDDDLLPEDDPLAEWRIDGEIDHGVTARVDELIAEADELDTEAESLPLLGDDTGDAHEPGELVDLPTAAPAFDMEMVDDDNLDDEYGPISLVTETMADLYASQGLVTQAARVYRELLRSRPDDEGLIQKLEQVEDAHRIGGARVPVESEALTDLPGTELDQDHSIEPITEGLINEEVVPDLVEVEGLVPEGLITDEIETGDIEVESLLMQDEIPAEIDMETTISQELDDDLVMAQDLVFEPNIFEGVDSGAVLSDTLSSEWPETDGAGHLDPAADEPVIAEAVGEQAAAAAEVAAAEVVATVDLDGARQTASTTRTIGGYLQGLLAYGAEQPILLDASMEVTEDLADAPILLDASMEVTEDLADAPILLDASMEVAEDLADTPILLDASMEVAEEVADTPILLDASMEIAEEVADAPILLDASMEITEDLADAPILLDASMEVAEDLTDTPILLDASMEVTEDLADELPVLPDASMEVSEGGTDGEGVAAGGVPAPMEEEDLEVFREWLRNLKR